MSDFGRLAKEAYFQEQSLLDLSDDEAYTPNESVLNLERALAESKPTQPLPLPKKTSSFLGPTPREKQAQFEEHSMQRRASDRQVNQRLTRSSTALQSEAAKSSRTIPSQNSVVGSASSSKSRLKRTISLSQLFDKESIPFYRRAGAVPRELKSGKNVKPATDIKLAPEHKQLLKGKIVYFYPNDDISMARRRRIHKVIQLGAAWADSWSDDITHVILDDDTYTYAQLIRHLNRPIPSNVVVVKFDPYIPQCIDRGELLDPTAPYFAVKGAKEAAVLSQTPEPSHESNASQISLKIKASKRQMVTRGSQKTDSYPTEESVPSTHPTVDTVSSSIFEETVEDSFVMPSGASDEPGPKLADQFGDTLSQAIREAKALMHLPLDEEEEAESAGESGANHAEDSGTDEEPSTMGPERLSKLSIVSKASALRDKKSLNMSNFQCMNPNSNGYASQNPNARTIQILDEMCKHYEQMQDQWRTLSYRKCIATLKKQTVKITTAEQAAKLRFVGPRLAAKIEEIVLTDRLRRLESTKDNHLDVALRLFLGVYGAGLMQANRWVQAGYRTLEDLKAKAKLSESQRIGVEHYDDFNSRIPRTEVESHGAIVIAALNKIDPQFSATIMGSYRRGAEDSGDIDMILSRPNTSLATMRTTIFELLIPHLYRNGFLKASLTTSRSDSSGSKWHGASCLPTSTIWRRIDFLLVPEQEMGAALLYFTGNDIFNRSMRLLARKKGMSLNQKGLYKDVQRGRQGEKLSEGILVESRSERRIFEILGVPWREPNERVC